MYHSSEGSLRSVNHMHCFVYGCSGRPCFQPYRRVPHVIPSSSAGVRSGVPLERKFGGFPRENGLYCGLPQMIFTILEHFWRKNSLLLSRLRWSDDSVLPFIYYIICVLFKLWKYCLGVR